MWLLFARASPPDAPYWPGRRLLSVLDAIGWPSAWIVLATQLPPPAGVVGLAVIAVAVTCALARLRQALWLNHRYHFTTWRWIRLAAALLLIGAGLKIASSM
jgi:hypothetical protein